jgi:predicted metal-dependent HD superfamily phosphohydrolase
MTAALEAAYATPTRAYHHFGHVHEVLAQAGVADAVAPWSQPREVFLAILYHDAIYQPGRRDNEARSADLAVAEIERHLPDAGIATARVAELIELTAQHGKLAPDDVDEDAARFLDCDMAILAAEPALFDAYDRGIAAEFRGKLPVWLFEFNRRRFLKGLLAKERIFVSDSFHTAFDARARANLQRLLRSSRSALRAGAGR